jgi:hypothetical protein
MSAPMLWLLPVTGPVLPASFVSAYLHFFIERPKM